MTPRWLETTPPIALGLLLGSIRHAGYEAKGFDFNVESWYYAHKPDELDEFRGYFGHELPSTSELRAGLDNEDWWGYVYNANWFDKDRFDATTLPKFKTLWDSQIDELLEYNPDLFGFNLNNTNKHSMEYMLKIIKKKRPDIPIVVGGSSCSWWEHWLRNIPEIEAVVSGEGEYAFLELLENYKKTGKPGHVKSVAIRDVNGYPYLEDEGERKRKTEDFDRLPFPDYSDFPMDLYRTPGEVAIQGSRGCVAKCTFCFETNYWRNWRQKSANTLYREMKTMFTRYGAKSFHYVDSLINGDVKLLTDLCNKVIDDPEIENFRFFGYARVHRQQTRELLAKYAKAGITYMSYGIESGSNRVLKNMKKGTNREICSQNLRDSALENIYTHANWIVGYPTETILDHLQSLIFTYNNRFYFTEISPGPTLGLQDLTEIVVQPEKFNMGYDLIGEWYTKDYKNTIIHRLVRLKCFLIWLQELEIVNAYSPDIKDHWSFEHKNTDIQTWSTFNIRSLDFYDDVTRQSKNIPETFTTLPYFEESPDFLYKLPPEQFTGELWEKTVRAELIAFTWMLYITYGECKLSASFDQEKDPFPDWFRPPYTATINFIVTETGEFELQIKHKLAHVNNKYGHPPSKQPTQNADGVWEKFDEKNHGYLIMCEPFKNEITHTGNIKNKSLDEYIKICDEDVWESIQIPDNAKRIQFDKGTKLFSTLSIREKHQAQLKEGATESDMQEFPV